MDLTGLTDAELLSRRHQAFLRLTTARGFDARRANAYEEIRLINEELGRRRTDGSPEKTRVRELK
ncbi:MAG TPA: hypothetical protein VE953_21960 [Terriglobales bacterium]|nr:hypothetical protein [Terriglobales bacterium]